MIKFFVFQKHSLLQNWVVYLEQIEKIRKLTTSGATSRRKDIALRGREQLSPLDHSKFFLTYPKLLSKREEIDDELSYLIHNTEKYMRRAIIAYFKLRFNDKKVSLIKNPKQSVGVQVSIFFKVILTCLIFS